MNIQYHPDHSKDRLSRRARRSACPCQASVPDQHKYRVARRYWWCLGFPYRLVWRCLSTCHVCHSWCAKANHQPDVPISQGSVVPIRRCLKPFSILNFAVHHPFSCSVCAQQHCRKEHDNNHISDSQYPILQRFWRLVLQNHSFQYSLRKWVERHLSRFPIVILVSEHNQQGLSCRLGTS